MGLAETIAELNRKMNQVTDEQTPEPTDVTGWRNLYMKGFPVEVIRTDSKSHAGRSRWYTATKETFTSSLKRKFRLKENNDTETDVPF